MRVVIAILVNDSLQLQALRLMGLLRSLKSCWQGWTPCLNSYSTFQAGTLAGALWQP